MLFHFDDFDRTFSRVNDWQRLLDRALSSNGLTDMPRAEASGGAFDFHESEDALFVTADLPGVDERDLEVTLENDSLTLSVKRTVELPEGYRAHRSERRNYEFTRSFSLPTRVDPERVTAALKDGVFTLEMAKAAEVKPRQITVNAR